MKRIDQLRDEIDKLATAYYNGEELVSDKEYDALIEELRVLDPTDKRIPGMAGEEKNPAGYARMKHNLVTGTLSKQMTTTAFEKWFADMQKRTTTFHASTKMDGIGIELQYENGELVHAISRGDGYTGFDKIDIFKKIGTSTVGTLTASVRGELEVKNSLFKDPYFKDKKNPRNAVAGLFNRKASELTNEDLRILKQVVFIAYDIKSDTDYKTKDNVFKALSEMGFTTPASKTFTTLDELYEFRNYWAEERTKDSSFALDGIVVFNNTLDAEDQNEKVQKEATALKFDLTVAQTKLVGINWNLSGGRLTPIAEVEPVELEGAVVRQANLCNLSVINNLGIKIGDSCIIARMGSIIPKVLAKA